MELVDRGETSVSG